VANLPELPKSLTETIADWIIDQMMQGELHPGQELNIDALSREFGISQTPIREAIRTLQAEGIVECQYRRSPRIAPMDRTVVQDLYCCRIYMLTLSARLTVARMTDAYLNRFQTMAEEMRRTVARQDRDAYFELSIAFGDLLADAAGNSILSDIMALLRRRSLLLRYLSLQSEGRLEAGLHYHESLVDALAHGDGGRAERIIKEHLLDAQDVCLAVLAESTQPA
jgi:DNA-binding GntR family transcriptional regulator